MITLKNWQRLEDKIRNHYYDSWAEDYIKILGPDDNGDVVITSDDLIEAVRDFVECRRIEREEGEE